MRASAPQCAREDKQIKSADVTFGCVTVSQFRNTLFEDSPVSFERQMVTDICVQPFPIDALRQTCFARKRHASFGEDGRSDVPERLACLRLKRSTIGVRGVAM